MDNFDYLKLINNKLNDIELDEEGAEKIKKERKPSQREMFYIQLKEKKNFLKKKLFKKKLNQK